MLICIGIDDEQGNNDYLTHCCSKIPFIKLMSTYTDPFAAIPHLASGIIDVLFLDFNLGGMAAPDFMQYVPDTVKVIIVSSEMESTIRGYNMQITAVLNKPFPCQRLLEICKSLEKRKH